MEDNMPTHRPTCIILTAPDPDALQLRSHGETGGTLEVRCETPNHPFLEVRFVGDNPFDDTPDAVFPGAMDRPAIIPLNKTGRYEFYIHHFGKDCKPTKKSGPYPCNIHSCGACR